MTHTQQTILYTTTLSANGRKALALAEHLELDIHIETVNVYQGEGNTPPYRAINPWGKIPSLVDGDFTLWESNAILIYLSEKCDGKLFSQNTHHRGRIYQWLFWESAHWQATLNRVLAPRVAQVLFNTPEDKIETNWNDGELRQQLGYLERLFSGQDYLLGNELSIADFSLAGMSTYFSKCDFPKHHYPSLSSWMNRFDLLDCWKSTLHELWQ